MTAGPDIAAGRLSPDMYSRNFADLAPALDAVQAKVAADRCFFCHDAPCMTACPTGIDVALFIRQISTGNRVGAARTILDANIMGAMCARVCPTETLCEQACVRETMEGKPVEIGRLQRYATDVVFENGHQFYTRGADTGLRVAVIGAGPAGLSCAHRLALLGHGVTLFEARDKLGGLNEFGIAAYKATGDIAQAEVDYILGIGGIEVRTGMALGRDISLQGLRAEFDAVFVGIGLGDTNTLGSGEDEGVGGVLDAVDYIATLRQARDLSALPVGRRVVVIGGGMTAIDAAVQARLLGAEDVTVVYRRGAAEMGASPYEQDVAQTRGVLLRHWARPVRVLVENGHVVALECERTTMREHSLVGTGETFILPCDQVFRAIGQTLIAGALAGIVDPATRRIAVDDEQRTVMQGVWAGGDCTGRGADLTVVAVEQGKRAALSIDAQWRKAAKAA